MAMAATACPFSRAFVEYVWLPNSIVATSFSRRYLPSESVFTMMFPNSSSLTNKPWVSSVYWKATGLASGGAPTAPGATCMFWLSMAEIISCGLTPRMVSKSGFSHRRIL